MTRIDTLLRAISRGGLALVAAGTLLALTIRDLEPLLAILFYATPWFLRAAGALLAIACWPRRKSVTLISAICLLIAISHGWQSHRSDPLPEPDPPSTIRVSLWNAGRRSNQRPDLWRQQGNADISALVESGPFTPSQFEAFKTANPHHEWRILNKGMMIGVRGSIRSAEPIGNG